MERHGRRGTGSKTESAGGKERDLERCLRNGEEEAAKLKEQEVKREN
jgi:hypothetical protein